VSEMCRTCVEALGNEDEEPCLVCRKTVHCADDCPCEAARTVEAVTRGEKRARPTAMAFVPAARLAALEAVAEAARGVWELPINAAQGDWPRLRNALAALARLAEAEGRKGGE
jgi:hypothetical protein